MTQADLDSAHLDDVEWDDGTGWPDGFDPQAHPEMHYAPPRTRLPATR